MDLPLPSSPSPALETRPGDAQDILQDGRLFVHCFLTLWIDKGISDMDFFFFFGLMEKLIRCLRKTNEATAFLDSEK